MQKNELSILIVEDEYSNAQYLKAVLKKLNYNVPFLATNATSALEITKENKIDIIFMDINLEGSIDGIFCAHMINEKKNIPIIFTTAYEESDTINDAMDTNIYGYLIKPFNYKDVEITLNIALKRAFQNESITEEKNEMDLTNGYLYLKETKTLLLDNLPVNLTKKESFVLNLLVKNINQIISYETLKEYIWQDKEVANSTIRDTILRLRKKTPKLQLENVSSVGYLLKTTS